MTDHPLTDEMIEQIAQFEPDLTDPLRFNRTNDMRVAYDLGESKGRTDMLNEVIEWLKDEIGELIVVCDSEGICDDRYLDFLKKEFIDDFKQAMRPQEEDNS